MDSQNPTEDDITELQNIIADQDEDIKVLKEEIEVYEKIIKLIKEVLPDATKRKDI